MQKTYHTACPRNCYSTCSFKVSVEHNQIVDIEPQSLNKATPEGPCIKGLSYKERAHSKDRILYPLKKINGKFERISWKEALDEIADKLRSFKDEFGSHSILFYAASGMSGLLNGVSTAFLEEMGRNHHRLWQSLLACRSRSHSSDARRKQTQCTLGFRKCSTDRPLGKKSC